VKSFSTMIAHDQIEATISPIITIWTTIWAWRNSSMKEWPLVVLTAPSLSLIRSVGFMPCSLEREDFVERSVRDALPTKGRATSAERRRLPEFASLLGRRRAARQHGIVLYPQRASYAPL
jgi:hypothetical protein